VHSAYHPIDNTEGNVLQRDAQTDACVKMDRVMQRNGSNPDDTCVSAALTTFTTSAPFSRWMLTAMTKKRGVAEGVRSWAKQLPGLCFLGSRPSGSSRLCRHQASLNAKKVYGVMAALDFYVADGMITSKELRLALASDLMYPHVRNVLREMKMIRLDDQEPSVISSTNVSTMFRAVGIGSRAKWLSVTTGKLKNLWLEEAESARSADKRKWCTQCASHTNDESTAWNICKVTSVIGAAAANKAERRKKFKCAQLNVKMSVVRKVKAKHRRVARRGT
jgi:hypothetical protein